MRYWRFFVKHTRFFMVMSPAFKGKKGWRYYPYYPIAYIKFMWFSICYRLAFGKSIKEPFK